MFLFSRFWFSADIPQYGVLANIPGEDIGRKYGNRRI
jgi:hypothetical protein